MPGPRRVVRQVPGADAAVIRLVPRLCLGTSSDAEVLALAANPERTCTVPAPEDVAAAARKAGGADDGSDLRDWYAPAVAALPLHLARIVCQRRNCRWDAELRRRYAGLLFVAMLALPLLELLWSEQDGRRLQVTTCKHVFYKMKQIYA